MSRVLIIGNLAESLINFRGDLISHLVEAGHEVTAVAPAGPEWVDAHLAARGARRIVVPMDRTGTNAVADVRLFWALLRACRASRPDVVLAYTIKPVIYGTLAAKLAGVRTIAAMITGLGFAFTRPAPVRKRVASSLARMLYRLTMVCTDIVFFQNPDDEADLRRTGILRRRHRVVRISGSGVNLMRFGQRPLPDGPMRFLMIARLLRDKGVSEYLEAARRVRAVYPAAQFHLVGPFDSNPTAISPDDIATAQARGDIVYHGATDDVRPFLERCHVYVLPSYREGTPRSVLEAMATGRPVITTDAPGCRETVNPGENGFLVPPREVAPLVDAMTRFINMAPAELNRMAAAARRRAELKYDVATVNATISGALFAT